MVNENYKTSTGKIHRLADYKGTYQAYICGVAQKSYHLKTDEEVNCMRCRVRIEQNKTEVG